MRKDTKNENSVILMIERKIQYSPMFGKNINQKKKSGSGIHSIL